MKFFTARQAAGESEHNATMLREQLITGARQFVEETLYPRVIGDIREAVAEGRRRCVVHEPDNDRQANQLRMAHLKVLLKPLGYRMVPTQGWPEEREGCVAITW